MPTTVIEAQKRTPGGKNANRRIRCSGRIPAVMYGPGKEPVAISVDPQAIRAVLHSEAGRNSIFGLSIEGSREDNAMVKDYQLDPVKDFPIHVDFLRVGKGTKLNVQVHVNFINVREVFPYLTAETPKEILERTFAKGLEAYEG